MFHDIIKEKLLDSISKTVSGLDQFVRHPGRDFTRNRKLPASRLILFLISQGSSGTANELMDFFDMESSVPSVQAFMQQRAKLKPEALEAVFGDFVRSAGGPDSPGKYRYLAADGSTLTFGRDDSGGSAAYHVSEGHSKKGFNSMHINAFYDLDSRTYTDALLQPVHEKDEFRAFRVMADRSSTPDGTSTVFIGDRGYASYNNMAHVIEKGQYFLFRTKDTASRGMAAGLGLPDTDTFDETVTVTIVRSRSKKIGNIQGTQHYVDKKTSFDYVQYGSLDTYTMTLRFVRFPISDTEHECLVTNLPVEEFTLERLKKLYFRRWGIESAFRKLKYTIGLNNFHSQKPEYVMQEVWARLITYNFTELVTGHVTLHNKGKKHTYRANFSAAAHICMVFLRPYIKDRPIDVEGLIRKHVQPVREDRQYKRLKTAHFRKPVYFTYRAA